MRVAKAALLLTAFAYACSSDEPVTLGPSASAGAARPPQAAALEVGITVNDAPTGSFACRDGLFIATTARNISDVPVRLSRLELLFTPSVGGCHEQAAPIDPQVVLEVRPQETVELRRHDGAGQLCGPPNGAPECGWTATARVTTEAGTVAEGRASFWTHEARSECRGIPPSIAAPREGDRLAGVVDVRAGVSEDGGCTISARTIIEGYDESGRRAFVSGELDLGDRYRWDTRQSPNGRYRLTALQNCCRIRGLPLTVEVAN